MQANISRRAVNKICARPLIATKSADQKCSSNNSLQLQYQYIPRRWEKTASPPRGRLRLIEKKMTKERKLARCRKVVHQAIVGWLGQSLKAFGFCCLFRKVARGAPLVVGTCLVPVDVTRHAWVRVRGSVTMHAWVRVRGNVTRHVWVRVRETVTKHQ